MCHFVTVALPSAQVMMAVKSFEAAGLAATRVTSSNLVALLPGGHGGLLVTDGHCSCELVTMASSKAEEALRADYARRGWSAAKVERALEDKRQAARKRPVSKLRTAFFSVVRSLVRSTGRVLLHRHFYRGAVAEEELPEVGSITLPVEHLEADEAGFPEDCLVTVEEQ